MILWACFFHILEMFIWLAIPMRRSVSQHFTQVSLVALLALSTVAFYWFRIHFGEVSIPWPSAEKLRFFSIDIAAINLLLLAFSAFVLALWNRRTVALAYGVGLPALLVFYLNLSALTAHLLDSPLLYRFGLSLLECVLFLVLSLAMLIGTVPLGGLFSPLLSSNRQARWIAIAAILSGLSILAFRILSLLTFVPPLDITRLSQGVFQIYTSTTIAMLYIATIMTALGMRSAFFYAKAATVAVQQERLAERESLLRHISETMHSSLELDRIFELIVNLLRDLLQADRCLISRYDAELGQILPPVKEARSSDSVPSMLETDTDFSAENFWIVQKLQEKARPFFFRSSDPFVCPSNRPTLQALQVRTGLVCPVLYSGKILAILMIHHNRERLFSPEDIDLVENIGIQAAIAVHQAELYEEKVSAQNELNRQLEFNRLLNDSLGEGVFAIAADGKAMFLNPAAETMLGWKQEEMLGRPILTLIHNAPFPETCAVRPEAPDRDIVQASVGCESRFIRRDGVEFPVLYTCAPIWANGQEAGYIFTFQDVTDLKHAQDELIEYAHRLQQSNKELEQFAYLASHDLQAPLIKLQKFSGMLKHARVIGEEELDIVNRMEGSARRMQSLVQDLLALARVSSMRHSFEPLNPDVIVRQILEDFDERIQALGAKIDVGPMESIDADPDLLRQLLQNLLDNALKFHREGVRPEIRIYARKQDEKYCQIVVEDNGIGFRQESAERIFDMFTRLHGVSQYGGNGIGLAICKKAVEHHQGTIEAFSKPGEGATFVATLPCHQLCGIPTYL